MAQVALRRTKRTPGELRGLGSPKAMSTRRSRKSALRLFFPVDAKALRTPFRAHALQLIYDHAATELGPALESAVVATWSQLGEPDSTVLVLNIAAKVDEAEARRVRKAVLSHIAQEASLWSMADKEDYGERIYFDVDSVGREAT